MRIIGCDLHAAQQTIAMLDGDTGEVVERTLTHDGETVRAFYASIPGPAVVGIEATGSMGWVLRLLEGLASPCRVGHPAAVRKAETRRQKHDRRDADLLLKLLVEDRFPAIWMPSTEQRDLRALLLHRHQWVRMRTRVPQALEAMALVTASVGVPRCGAGPARRRSPRCLCRRMQHIAAVSSSGCINTWPRRSINSIRGWQRRSCRGRRRRDHPGVGPVTALATEVFLGDPGRFADGKALASYVGMIPSEYSSGSRQRLGALSKQGNPLLRFLWGEAAMHAVRRDPELQRLHGYAES